MLLLHAREWLMNALNGPTLQGEVISLLLDPQRVPLLKTANCSAEQEEELGILFCSA